MADAIAEFEEICKNASLMQEELLTSILLKNADCEYLRKFGSSRSRPLTVSEFRSQVPVVSYEDVASEIERVANGDKAPVLCSEPILRFFASSGTSSGKHKFIPVTAGYLETATNFLSFAYGYRSRCFPGTGKALGFFYCIPELTTKSGLPVGAITTYRYKSEFFRTLATRYTTPYEVLLVDADWREQTYCHLLCALLQRNNVESIQSPYAYTICEAFRMFESDWQEICTDIEAGRLSKKITNQELREALESSELFRTKGGAASDAAKSIAGICSRKSWEGILPLLFPNLKFICTVVTGALKHYVPALRSYLGSIPIVSEGYLSSEGILGINIDPLSPPERVVYTVVPTSVYYEFVPVSSTRTPLGVDEVVVGQQYEIVVTNSAGLYRFKVGDVLNVASFFHGAPQMAFSYRKSAVLNVQNEMVDEQELQNVMNVANEFDIKVINYTTYGDRSSASPHYVVFWELGKSADSKLLQECCSSIDRSFNIGYFMKRVDKLIGPLKLVIVSQGTFQKLVEDAVENGTSPGQYKTPRCVMTSKSLETLYSRHIDTYTSGDISKSVLTSLEVSFPDRNTL